MENARIFFDTLNQEYLQVHKAKEDLFWATYMAISTEHEAFAKAQTAFHAFISDQEKLRATRQHLAALAASPQPDAQLQVGLQGWLALFEANVLDNEEATQLMRELIAAESAFFAANQQTRLYHINESGEREVASLVSLQMNMAMNPVEAYRKSSFEALQQKEEWVLENGFLDIVRLRNKLARILGFANFFEYRLKKNEQMATIKLFAILDDFELRTRAANLRALAELKEQHGAAALAPWNIRFHQNGDVMRALDPYMPFAKGLQRWIDSFVKLGIGFRGASLQLDLCEREGKYQNGFCHIPAPSYFNANQEWQAAAINFTSMAKPNQVGSGIRALKTLFHEGGHAAHFANVAQNSPCFSQEFAPTSMAYAETQSMFCDSLLGDADWLKRYAKNAQGEALPDELIHAMISLNQPFMAFNDRSIALVAYFESAMYQLEDDKLTPQTVLRLARATETSVLGTSASPRPLLSIPHLLSQESAASYHGYLLASMAVEQTRAYFLQKYGYLTDNPAIGPELAQHYWQCGNRQDHNSTLESLTGQGFNAQYLADRCNMSVDDAWAEAKKCMQAASQRTYPTPTQSTLDAKIALVHGAEHIADNAQSDAAMCAQFETWLAARYPNAENEQSH